MRELGNDLPLMGNSHEITAHHFILDLDVDMDHKVIDGIITLFLKPSYRQICGTDFVLKKDEDSSSRELKKESSNCDRNKDLAGSSGFKLEVELEGNTPVSNCNNFFNSSSKPEKETSRSEKVSGTEPDSRTEFEGVGTTCSSVDQVGTSVETCNDVSRESCNLDFFYTTDESSEVKDCCTQSDSKTHGDFQLILDCCDIEILHVEEVLFTQDEMTRKAGRIESIRNATYKSSSQKYSVSTHESNVFEQEDGYSSYNGRQDTFDIFSKLMTDSKQNLAQERKANLSHNDESLQNPNMHVDHTYCYNCNSAQSCVENCRTTTLSATHGENTATTAEFHNDHDYLESKKSVLRRTSKLEVSSKGQDMARDEQSDKDFDISEDDSRRKCCVPELSPTASKEEAKEVFTTLMGVHNCSSGRPLHHRVEPWCLRIWREGVGDRESFPRVVRIKYRTTPEGGSLTWVTDQDGKPCMFTQGSCINNRSLFPCHDFLTMATWQAVVHAPRSTTVLMSGEEPGVPWQPDAVTKQPDAVTKQPDAVTKQPDAVTKQPDAITKEPDAVTKQYFTKQPEAVTKQPEVVTEQPDAVTKEPDAVTKQPDAVTKQSFTKQPEAVTKQPEAVTEQPDAVTKKADAVTKQPDAATKQPKQPGAVTKQPEGVTKQPEAVTRQPDHTRFPAIVQTDPNQDVEFVSKDTDLNISNISSSFNKSVQMQEVVASVARQCDVAQQQADTEAHVNSKVAARDHHYFYVTMPMPCSTLALAVGYWPQASSEENTTQEHNDHFQQPSTHSANAQDMAYHLQPDLVVQKCDEVVRQRQLDSDNTTRHDGRSIQPPTLPSVTNDLEEQNVLHRVCAAKDHISQITEQVCQQEDCSDQQRSCCKVDHVRVIPHRVFAPSLYVHEAGREFLPLIEKYLSAAYDVLGPHPLPRLDILIVPRCFASLGLASPHLMLVSQSLLAGDGSMCLRLAHEIAHSWFGLLIGSRDWTEEWISEGFATYLEDCIHARAMGWTEKESQEVSDLRACIRYRLLAAELDNTEEELQTLRPSASGQGFHQGEGTVYVTNALNTDKLFTQVHYLKGYFLLRYFTKKVGAEKFHSLLKSFVQQFPRHGMNLIFSQDFFNLVFKTFPSLSSQGLTVERIYQDWLDCPGLPKQLQKNPVNASNRLVKQVREALKHWKDVDKQNRQSDREARKMRKRSRDPIDNSVRRKKRQIQTQTAVCEKEESNVEKNIPVHDRKRNHDITDNMIDSDITPPPTKRQPMGGDIPNKESDFESPDSQSDVPLRTDLPSTSHVNEGGVSAHESKAGKELLQDQLVLLLEELLEMKTLATETLHQLEKHYGLSKCNADVRHRWCELVIKHGYSPRHKDVQQFLCEDQAMGVYLYGELMAYEQPQQQQLARETFRMLSPEMEEGPRKAVQEMLYGGDGDD